LRFERDADRCATGLDDGGNRLSPDKAGTRDSIDHHLGKEFVRAAANPVRAPFSELYERLVRIDDRVTRVGATKKSISCLPARAGELSWRCDQGAIEWIIAKDIHEYDTIK
jgi:hypothetical protein